MLACAVVFRKAGTDHSEHAYLLFAGHDRNVNQISVLRMAINSQTQDPRDRFFFGEARDEAIAMQEAIDDLGSLPDNRNRTAIRHQIASSETKEMKEFIAACEVDLSNMTEDRSDS
jgi:hypothetical protein